MYDLDAIAAINIDQLATATDRLLVGGLRKRRPLPRGSVPVVIDDEPTLFMRHAPTRGLRWAAVAGAVAGVFAIALIRLLA
jgi:hypothetical protein